MENDNDYIIIPNPIYDVVFKYLMEDLESAKIVLSTLIGENIIELNFEPTSHTEKIKDPETDKEIKLFHLDFTATVALSDGTTEVIMIEIQKAKVAGDILRFKRYISANFQKKQRKAVTNQRTGELEERDFPIRLLPIFILNFRIENEINELLIKTGRVKYCVFKEKELQKQNEFIDNLSYDLYVVQLPNLQSINESEYENDEYKSKLFVLLKLFDQESQVLNDRHRLRIFRTLFPDFLDRIIKRLRTAYADNPELEEQMNAEDEYLSELIRMHNDIAFLKEKFEEERKKKEEERKEKEEARQKEKEARQGEKEARQREKEASQKEKEASQREKEARQREKEARQREKEANLKLAKIMKSNSATTENIVKETGLSEQEIEEA